VPPPLPDRKIGTVHDIGIIECAERDGDHVGEVAAGVMDGGTAFRAEAVGRGLAAVGGAGPFLRDPLDLDAVSQPARLHRESAAGALLTSEAMTDGDADRVT